LDIDAATDDGVLWTVDIFTFTSTLALERWNLAPLLCAGKSARPSQRRRDQRLVEQEA
jgi:hypothetical protein